jgi:hypothetical protein
MQAADFPVWFLDTFGWRLDAYRWHLLGCLIFWIALCFLTSVNRASAFIFAFSAWFLLHWVVDTAAFILKLPYLALDPMFIALSALPIGLFAYCTISSLLALRAPRDVEADAARVIRLGWALLPAHLIHVFYLVVAEYELSVPY